MKNWSFLLLAFLLCSFQEQEPINDSTVFEAGNDKEFLKDYSIQTREKLEELTKGLSEAQLNYKVSEDRWSISQCLEHIVLTENALFQMTTNLMEQPAAPQRRSELKASDEQLIAGMEDRSQKAQAPEELQPLGIYSDPDVAIAELQDQREDILEFIHETSEEDLRNHISDSPFGPIDAYQSLLFIAGHTARHTNQIEEILDEEGFPAE